ncbi:MAG: hypothetical protein ABIU29_04990, partial [Chthoniobacterales bacterium]
MAKTADFKVFGRRESGHLDLTLPPTARTAHSARCLSAGATRRSLAVPVGAQPARRSARMRQKIDLPESRRIYARR